MARRFVKGTLERGWTDAGVPLGEHRTATGTSVTVTAADKFVECTNAGTITVTLPSAVTYPGLRLCIKRGVGAGATTVNTVSSQTIDGVTSKSLASAGDILDIISNGTYWCMLKHGAP